MDLTPSEITSLPLTPLRAEELLLFAEIIRIAYQEDPNRCARDAPLQKQILALHSSAEGRVPITAGLCQDDLTHTANLLEALREQLDAIRELDNARVIQWATEAR